MTKAALTSEDVCHVITNCKTVHTDTQLDSFIDHKAQLPSGQTVGVRASGDAVTDVWLIH